MIKPQDAGDLLNELMYHISFSHCDMGGKHRYVLRADGWPVVSKIKAWQAKQADPVDRNLVVCPGCGYKSDPVLHCEKCGQNRPLI